MPKIEEAFNAVMRQVLIKLGPKMYEAYLQGYQDCADGGPKMDKSKFLETWEKTAGVKLESA